jgi:hypothetical protein
MKTFSSSGFRAASVDQMRLLDTVIFTSSGTFDPANYPYAGALRVWVQAGGGGGGGWTSSTVRNAGGGGGGGCVYAEMIKGSGVFSVHFDEPNTVTVGLGGAGATGDNVSASAGGNSSFVRSISGGGPTAYGGSGGRGYLSDESFARGNGGGSGHSGTVYSGGPGGYGKTAPGAGSCTSDLLTGVGGSGGIEWTSAAKYLAANPILRFHSNYSFVGDNNGSTSANMTARTTNTGAGGSGVGIQCTGAQAGYGQGGDSGIVIVEVWG